MNSSSNNAKFDLNVLNYTKTELEQLFELPSSYDESVIEIQETKLRQNIMNDYGIAPIVKNQTLTFISEVKKQLAVNILRNNNGGNGNNGNNSNGNNGNNSNGNNGNNGGNHIASKFLNLNKGLVSSEVVSSGSTFIIDKVATPYGQSQPSEFYQGTINPLNKRTLKQNINIDTRFRDNYYSTVATNFHLDLPIRLNQVVSLQLTAFELPETFYTISSAFGNNFFVVIIEGESYLIVIIPDGNYTNLELQNYINDFIQTQTLDVYKDIQFIVDIYSTKMIASSISGTTVFSLSFQTDIKGFEAMQDPLQMKLGWLMGYRMGLYVDKTSFTPEACIDLSGSKYIYLVIDDFNNSVNDGFYGAFTSSILNKNILARISIQGNASNVVSQNNLSLITTARQYFGPVDIQKIHIQLLDEYGRIINLNFIDYSFCLTFQTIYNL